MKRAYFILPLTLLLSGCSAITLDRLSKTHPGSTSTREALSLLGKPGTVLDYQEKVVWIYGEGPFSATRASLIFDTNGTLVSKTWFPRKGEPETDLTIVKSKVSKSPFERVQDDRNQGHASLEQEIFENSKEGVYITYDKTPQKVRAITWSSTASRVTASTPPASSAAGSLPRH
jgi:hypothetical protein